MYQVVDFGPGPQDETQGYPFEGSEAECSAWIAEHQEMRADGSLRYGLQETPDYGD
jgi:hypothetical protein